MGGIEGAMDEGCKGGGERWREEREGGWVSE